MERTSSFNQLHNLPFHPKKKQKARIADINRNLIIMFPLSSSGLYITIYANFLKSIIKTVKKQKFKTYHGHGHVHAHDDGDHDLHACAHARVHDYDHDDLPLSGPHRQHYQFCKYSLRLRKTAPCITLLETTYNFM